MKIVHAYFPGGYRNGDIHAELSYFIVVVTAKRWRFTWKFRWWPRCVKNPRPWHWSDKP